MVLRRPLRIGEDTQRCNGCSLNTDISFPSSRRHTSLGMAGSSFFGSCPYFSCFYANESSHFLKKILHAPKYRNLARIKFNGFP